MPKENTHLYFADQFHQKNKDLKIKDLIEKYKDFFYLGSVSPDIFYYLKSTESISEFIHGKNNQKTNLIIFEWLEETKKTQSEKDFIFICGYLTHCALDIIFHPAIFGLTGDYYDQDISKRRQAIYSHRHIETALDAQLNHKFNFKKHIFWKKTLELNSIAIILKKRFNLNQADFIKAFKSQYQKNLFFKNLNIFYLAYWLNKLHLKDFQQELGLFYGNLIKNPFAWDQEFEYQDLFSQEKKIFNLNQAFTQADNYAKIIIEGAFDFYTDKINFNQLSQIIKGENLNSGI